MGSQLREENSEYAYLASVSGNVFCLKCGFAGAGKRVTMPTMLLSLLTGSGYRLSSTLT